MDSELARLKSEMEAVSSQIYALKQRIEESNDPREIKIMQQEVKQLQYQVLFYIELKRRRQKE